MRKTLVCQILQLRLRGVEGGGAGAGGEPGRRSHISVRRGENIVYITSADGLPTSHAECV